MRNRFFVFDLLFDFYGVRGSTATHSARSSVKQCGVTIFSGTNGETQFFFISMLVSSRPFVRDSTIKFRIKVGPVKL